MNDRRLRLVTPAPARTRDQLEADAKAVKNALRIERAQRQAAERDNRRLRDFLGPLYVAWLAMANAQSDLRQRHGLESADDILRLAAGKGHAQFLEWKKELETAAKTV
jgi:hypothetical protein